MTALQEHLFCMPKKQINSNQIRSSEKIKLSQKVIAYSEKKKTKTKFALTVNLMIIKTKHYCCPISTMIGQGSLLFFFYGLHLISLPLQGFLCPDT